MTVQARLGHAFAFDTLDTCSHLWPDSDDRTREAIDSVLAESAEFDLSPRVSKKQRLSRSRPRGGRAGL